jgi:hypothetical protein
MKRILMLLAFVLAATPVLAARGNPEIDLESWDIQPILAGLPVQELIGKPVVDATRHQVGTVADILFAVSGQAMALIVDTPNGVAAYDWRRVGVTPNAQSAWIEGPGGPDPIPLPGKTASDTPRPFFATELIGDRARLDDARSFGIVRGVIVTADGRLSALAVYVLKGADVRSPTGIYPFPFYGYQFPRFNPAYGYYEMPYNAERVYRYATRYPLLDKPKRPTR